MENTLYTKCSTGQGFEQGCMSNDRIQALLHGYCACNLQNLTTIGQESITTKASCIVTGSPNIDLFSLMKPSTELVNAGNQYTMPGLAPG